LDLEDVFRTYQSEIYTYFVRLDGNAQEAEELAQDTFVRACSAALRFRGDSSVRTWLFGIAHRTWLESLRRRRTAAVFPDFEERTSERDDPAERVHLIRTLASLGESDREAITLVDVVGLAPSEAAAVAGAGPETFRVRLHRARQRFRERYEA
jgi:RNA polymerase sigma-70 factor (ECF subfamily)